MARREDFVPGEYIKMERFFQGELRGVGEQSDVPSDGKIYSEKVILR